MSSDTTFQKIKKAYSVKTNSELAEQLNTTRGAVEGWSRRNEVPHKYLIQCTLDTGVSLDWLLNNDKPTFHISGGSGVVGQQTNHGNVGQHNTFGEKKDETPKIEENNIDEATFILFKEAYIKAGKNNEINRLRLYLMEFQ